MHIMGIHDGHNSSACLLINGKIRNVIQEERLKGEKNFGGFPEESIRKILHINKLDVSDIDYWVFAGKHTPYSFDLNSTMKAYGSSATLYSKGKDILKKTFLYDIYKKNRETRRKESLLRIGVSTNKIDFVDHHMCHAASAYFGCPWRKETEKMLILTQDGSGDGLSGSVNIGYKGKIERIASIKKEDSLARIYALVTFMMGMIPLEHEYKLMGMAPYAPKEGKKKAYEVFKDLLKIPEDNPILWKRKRGLPPTQNLYPFLRKNTERLRFDWIAAGLQQFTEEILIKWVSNCVRETKISNIGLSGGTFMNVKANQKIYELPGVKKIFIMPSCGDESNSIGAAFYLQSKLTPATKIEGIKHIYFGPEETHKAECLKYLEKLKNETSLEFKFRYIDNIEDTVADLLASGHIVARCKGPMEFGARALGNRSILSAADDLQKISIINNMIKNRDFWMPFAPVLLKETSDNYIINPKKIESPYMMLTFDSTDKCNEFIGGVQQVDKTARAQIIDEEYNPEYYKILKQYENLTGKGVLVNTSFNLHGLPIVYGPKEALYVFEHSGLNYLALGNFLVEKKVKS